MRKHFGWLIALILAVFIFVSFIPLPAEAIGLTFGGKILSSQTRVCLVGVGPFAVYVPMQVLYLGAPSYKTVEYIWYTAILQAFHVTTSIYNFGQFYRAGPNVLGQYIPVPIPWENCEFYPTNIITKIGTSAF